MLAALFLCPPACAEGFPPNRSFEDEGAGWSALGQARAEWPQGKRGAGARCLRLGGGWVVSDPSAAEDGVRGWQRLTFLAQPEPNAGDLALAFVPDPGPEPVAELLLGPQALPPRRWHRVQVEVFAPPSEATRLAFGSPGEGAWLIDDVAIQPFDLAAQDSPEDAPVLMEPLPDGWQPDGLLDARARTLGTERELIIQVHGLQITISDRVRVARGQRGGLRLYADNRGRIEKDLTVAVQAPLGFYAPERTVPIRGGGKTALEASVQCLVTGEFPVRLEFRCEDEVKAAPLLVECVPSQPVFGAAWTGATAVPAGQVEAGRALPVQLHQVLVSSMAEGAGAALPPGVELVALLGPPWSGQACEQAVRTLGQRAAVFGLHSDRASPQLDSAADLTAALAQAVRDAGCRALLQTPPLDLTADGGLVVSPQAVGAVSQLVARGAPIAAALRLPPLRTGTVTGLVIDGRPSQEPLSCWTRVADRYDLTAVASTLRRDRAGLPLVICELCAQPSGSEALDALALARVVTSAVYLGAAAFSLCARPDDCPPGADALALVGADGRLRPQVAQVWAELTRELAGARPIVALKQDEQIGLAPRAPIGFRPFLRGREGVLALWNNTGAPVALAVEVRCAPTDLHYLEVDAGGLRRHYTSLFRFSEEARRLGRPLVFVELEPVEFVLLSMQLANAHAGWLAGVEFKPRIPPVEKPRDQP